MSCIEAHRFTLGNNIISQGGWCKTKMMRGREALKNLELTMPINLVEADFCDILFIWQTKLA